MPKLRRTLQFALRSTTKLSNCVTSTGVANSHLFDILSASSSNYYRIGYSRREFHASSKNLKRDYYEVLGVDRGANKDEIKKKYFALAKKFHPDVNKDDPKAAEKFREASEAYEVLENDEKRKLYDSFGHSGVDPSSGMGGGGAGPFGGFGGFQWNFNGGATQINEEEMADIIGQMFGQQARPRRNRGADLRTSIRLSFLRQ